MGYKYEILLFFNILWKQKVVYTDKHFKELSSDCDFLCSTYCLTFTVLNFLLIKTETMSQTHNHQVETKHPRVQALNNKHLPTFFQFYNLKESESSLVVSLYQACEP